MAMLLHLSVSFSSAWLPFPVEDEDHSGRPTTSRSADNISIVDTKMQEYRRKTMLESSLESDLLYSNVGKIVTVDLGMKCLVAKWIPRILTDEQKAVSLSMCRLQLSLILSGGSGVSGTNCSRS
jgi:hypothetical protein